jgi:beta-lactamase class A
MKAIALSLLLLTVPPPPSWVADHAPATMGVAAVDLESGRSVRIRADERFPMGSVFKFPTALTFLRLVDQKKFDLDAKVTIPVSAFAPGYSPIRDNAHGKPVTMTYRDIVIAMLRESDNTAADFLLPKVGGPAAVTKRLRELGIDGIRVDRSETQMAADLHKPGGVARYAVDPRDTATPNATVELLRKFWLAQDGLSPEMHAFAMKQMLDTPTGAKRIKAALPAGATLAHKTGTMPGTANDVGIITMPGGKHHVLIAIFMKAATTEEDEPREQAIMEMAEAVLRTVVPE